MEKCNNCGSNYEPKTSRQKWCSNGCKQDAHRKRHGIAKPSFLAPSKLGNIEPEEAKLPILMNGAKGVTRQRRTLTSEQVVIRGSIVGIEQQIALIDTKQQAKIALYTSLCNQNSQLVMSLAGGVVGGTIGYKASDSVGIGLVGALLLGWLGYQVGTELKARTGDRVAKRLADLSHEINSLTAQKTSFVVQKMALSMKFEKLGKEAIQTELKPIAQMEMEKAVMPELNLAMVPPKTKKTVTADQVMQMKFSSWPFKDTWADLFGQPEHGFYVGIYGGPGAGKTTLAVNFGKYLADNHGRVLFISSEMGISASLQSILTRGNVTGSLFEVMNARGKKYEEIREIIKSANCPFIIIDSLNDIGLTPEQMQAIRTENPKKSFIAIFQATKAGDFKGSNEHAHDLDVKVKVEAMQATAEKNRFAQLATISV